MASGVLLPDHATNDRHCDNDQEPTNDLLKPGIVVAESLMVFGLPDRFQFEIQESWEKDIYTVPEGSEKITFVFLGSGFDGVIPEYDRTNKDNHNCQHQDTFRCYSVSDREIQELVPEPSERISEFVGFTTLPCDEHFICPLSISLVLEEVLELSIGLRTEG